MLSKIKSIEIRACRGGDELESLDTVAAVKLPGGSRPDFTVVTITTEDEDMTVRAGQADGGGKGQGATVNVVHAMGVHEVGETAGAPDACNRDDFLMRNLELLQHAVENGQHGEVTATGAPGGVVGGEGFLGDFVGDRGRSGGGHKSGGK